MNTVIQHPETDEEIAATFEVMAQLRPHLERAEYVPLIRSMMESDGYRLLSLLEDGVVRAVAGYRIMHTLYCPRILNVDDLVTDERVRSHGHGARILSALRDLAISKQCDAIHLISRLSRERAHQFYLREGFEIMCYHFAFDLDQQVAGTQALPVGTD